MPEASEPKRSFVTRQWRRLVEGDSLPAAAARMLVPMAKSVRVGFETDQHELNPGLYPQTTSERIRTTTVLLVAGLVMSLAEIGISNGFENPWLKYALAFHAIFNMADFGAAWAVEMIVADELRLRGTKKQP